MKLEVEDDGPGIDDEEREHAFEPFFVGKAAEACSSYNVGLDLATVRACVRFHSGEIEIADARHPKRGARFRIQLPMESYAPVHG
jgi:two-component system sensor histidine kinase GlrK